ncbi:ATP-binding protein [Alginatibacterium sediminis]|uniref:ATP-binding protein n=1 Tax=Alginatibacterium sediminis TaxID=2164068 RepID=A0A420EH76_9ALTE|nr:AAA family ATPase [Alginatibacterium sediminis]RKF20017.1 ATP-binding protein [Alginatibacterium sediminis]
MRLTIIRGLPGSGKSTLAKQMCTDDQQLVHLEADQYFVNDKQEYHFDADHLTNAHAWCQNKCEQALQQSTSVVVSNTFVCLWEMLPYINIAKKYQAHLKVIECHDDFGSIHNVPDTTIEQMKKKWQKLTNIDPNDLSMYSVLGNPNE